MSSRFIIPDVRLERDGRIEQVERVTARGHEAPRPVGAVTA